MLFQYQIRCTLNFWQPPVVVQPQRAKCVFAVPHAAEGDVPLAAKTNMILPVCPHHVSELALLDAIFPKLVAFLGYVVPVFHHHITVEKFAQKIQFRGFLLCLILHSNSFPVDVPLRYAPSLFLHHAVLLRPAIFDKQKG